MTQRLLPALAGMLLAATAAAVVPEPSEAPAQWAPSLAETHDGLYFHLAAGLGFGQQANPDGRADFLESSSGRSLNLAVGGAVRRNLLVGVRYFAAIPSVGGLWSGTWGVRGFAADVTWYLGPRNVHLGVAPAVTWLTSQNGADASRGAGLRLAAGREWWVSDSWGIGLALEYLGSLNRALRVDGSAHLAASHWLGLALTATYN